MKRKYRLAWALSGLLALALLGGLSAFASYGRQTDTFTIQWQPIADWREWWVGKRDLVVKSCGPTGSRATLEGQTYSLGFVKIDVPYFGPEVVYYDTFPKTKGRLGHNK